jgi:hypothetical protein
MYLARTGQQDKQEIRNSWLANTRLELQLKILPKGDMVCLSSFLPSFLSFPSKTGTSKTYLKS